MPMKPFNPEASSTLAKDFKIFFDPGFVVALLLGLALFAAVGGAILFADVKYGISPF